MLAYNVRIIYRGELCTLCAMGTRAEVDQQINQIEKQYGIKVQSVEPLEAEARDVRARNPHLIRAWSQGVI